MRSDSWGAVLTGGKGPKREEAEPLLRRAGKIVAADSGFDLARSFDVVPDLVVGDMDSLEALDSLDDVPGDRIIRFSHEKDETDTEIALRLLREEGYERIGIVGGGGGRLDHLLALFALFERESRPAVWVSDRAFVYSLERDLVLKGHVGSAISFFPVGAEPCRMESEGLQWPLDGLEWRRGDVGVSNRVVDDTVRVSMTSGRLLMIGGLELLSGVFR